MTARVLVVGAVNVDVVVSTDELPGPGQTVVGAARSATAAARERTRRLLPHVRCGGPVLRRRRPRRCRIQCGGRARTEAST